MQDEEYELQVGDTLQVGEYTITIVDIDRGEVSVRIDPPHQVDVLRVEEGVVTLEQ